MNPWWNYAAESQAFGRVKRHGQTKETYMVRLFARGTIDERILDLQIKKMNEIKEALVQGRKPKPLTREEMHYLLTAEHLEPDEEPDEELSEDPEDDDPSGDWRS